MFFVRVALGFLLLSPAAVAQQYLISTAAGGALPATPIAGVAASIPWLSCVASDAAGNLYLTSGFAPYGNAVFKLDTAGTLSRVAGTGVGGYSGDGGPATNVQLSLSLPGGLAVEAFGNLYIPDTGNSRVRKVSASGIITTVAGGGSGGDGGPATSAQLNSPTAVAVDASGNLFISDQGQGRVWKVSTSGIITRFAGGGSGGDGGVGQQGRTDHWD